MHKTKKQIILASASPRRQKLLKKVIKSFTIVPSHVDESTIRAKTSEAFAVKAALAKAEEIALKHKNSIVIGADTIVVLGNEILGKPRSKKEATAMLKSLSGKIHKVITGLAVVDTNTFKNITDYEITKVRMGKPSIKLIKEYVDSGRPIDKAGAYGIQEIKKEFIDGIEGDYDNVVGLPVARIKELLKKFS